MDKIIKLNSDPGSEQEQGKKNKQHFKEKVF